MKTLSLAMAICCASIAVRAQSNRQFLDANYNEVKDSTSAAYYRIIKTLGGKYSIWDYYINGKISGIIECTLQDGMLVRHGKSIAFYENGKVMEEQVYALNNRHGPGKTFYPNGKLKSEIIYLNPIEKYVSYGSEDGSLTVRNGQGKFMEKDSDRRDIHVLVADSAIVWKVLHRE